MAVAPPGDDEAPRGGVLAGHILLLEHKSHQGPKSGLHCLTVGTRGTRVSGLNVLLRLVLGFRFGSGEHHCSSAAVVVLGVNVHLIAVCCIFRADRLWGRGII